MQADTISRLQHTSASSSSSVKTPSPLKGVQLPASATTQSQKQSAANNLGQLDNIFQSVRKQVTMETVVGGHILIHVHFVD